MDLRPVSLFFVLMVLAVEQDAARTYVVGFDSNENGTIREERSPEYRRRPEHNQEDTESPDLLGSLAVNWNSVLDYIITIVRQEILARGKEEIDIPDIDKEFVRFTVKGRFLATRGRLGRLSTLRRVGDVTVEKVGSSYHMTCDVGLDELAVRYGVYTARVWGHGPRGSLEAHVRSNALRVMIVFKVTPSGECLAELGGVEVLTLEGFDVKVTGLGFLNGLASRVASAQLEKRSKDLVAVVEEILTRELSNTLKTFQCTEYLSMLMF